ncbi:MAG: 2-methylcitrate dehydratase PrpD [Polaromonas sp.]|nr:2-methylcitrate dehydratase PrpD [Polaromonas sp.]
MAAVQQGNTRRIANWIATASRDWEQSVVAATTNAFADTLAVMCIGAAEPQCQRLQRTITALAGEQGSSTVVGGRLKLGVPWAALLNGTAAHYLDFDDVLDPSMSHASAVLVPAILAIAEHEHLSGAACVDGYLVGLEVLARLGETMNLAHYANGWHATSTIGSIGAAAACARLLQLDEDRSLMAISLATSMAGGSKSQFGTFAKPIHAGLAAKNGITAAYMAEGGVDACEEPLEGDWGYIAMTCGAGMPSLGVSLTKLGQPVAMKEFGVSMKVHPCCSSTHRPVDAILDVVASEGVTAGAVLRVEATISEVAAHNLRHSRPKTPAQARFSLEYCLAAALINGRELNIGDFQPAAVLNPTVQEFLPRVQVNIDHALASRESVALSSSAATVKVFMQDGTVLTRVVENPLGHPLNPLSTEHLRRKFESCTAALISADASQRAWEQVQQLVLLHDVDSLMGHFKGAPLAA